MASVFSVNARRLVPALVASPGPGGCWHSPDDMTAQHDPVTAGPAPPGLGVDRPRRSPHRPVHLPPAQATQASAEPSTTRRPTPPQLAARPGLASGSRAPLSLDPPML